MNKNKSVTLAIALSFLIVSLFVSMQLVRTPQETRRKAADGANKASIWMVPATASFSKIGEEKIFELKIKSEDVKKYDGVQFLKNICFNQNYINIVSVASVGMTGIYMEGKAISTSNTCLNLVFQPITESSPPSGEIILAQLKFKAVGKGEGSIVISTGKVKWDDKDNESLLVTGPEGIFTITSATGVSYEVKDETGKTYNRTTGCNKLTGEYTCAEVVGVGGSYATIASCKTDSSCYITYSHGPTDCSVVTGDWTCKPDAAGTFSSEAVCKVDPGCDTTNKFTRGACNYSTGKFACTSGATGDYAGLTECEIDPTKCAITATPTPTLTPTPTPTNTPTPTPTPPGGATNTPTPPPTATNTPTPPGGATNTPTPPVATSTPVPGSGGYVLKFKMIYPGLAKGSATDICMKDLTTTKLTVVAVLDSGATQTITINDVVLARQSDTVTREDTGNKVDVYVFKGQTVLPDSFPYSSRLAVFMDSKKHLTIKYGVDKQTSMFKKLYGELGGLKKDVATTPEFDFTGYPPLAGDVNGDDVVNVLDFTELKAAMNSTDSKYYGVDFTGDCMINSVDSAYFFASLKYKEGQIY